MLKEKLNQFLKGDGNNKKKIENLSFFLIILVITVISINFIWKDENEKVENNLNDGSKKFAINTESTKHEENGLESKLEDILSNINGVGKVKVLLTYNETEELIPVYNKTDKKSTTNEIDSSGGTRVIEEIEKSEEVVYQNEEIITQKVIT